MQSWALAIDWALLWTIIGTVATLIGTVIGVPLGVRQLRAKNETAEIANEKGGRTAPTLEELDSEAEWVDAQVEAIRSASYSVSLCLHTIHASDEVWKAERINAELATARSQRGVEVRVLAAPNPQCIRGAYELEYQLDVDVRFAPAIAHYDLRFLLADSEHVVLGLANPDREHGLYRPTSSWAVLRSASLCEALERDFQRMWLSKYALTATRYFQDTIRQDGPVPSARVATDLGIDYEVARRFASDPAAADVLGNAVLLFYGKSSSGKSTLMRTLARTCGAKCMDLRDVLLPNVHRYGIRHLDGRHGDDVFAELLNFCAEDNFDAIELTSDFNGPSLQRLIALEKSRGRRPVLVHCQVATATALQRNEHRTFRVQPATIVRQEVAERSCEYRDICGQQGVAVIELPEDTAAAETYDRLMQQIQQRLL